MSRYGNFHPYMISLEHNYTIINNKNTSTPMSLINVSIHLFFSKQIHFLGPVPTPIEPF